MATKEAQISEGMQLADELRSGEGSALLAAIEEALKTRLQELANKDLACIALTNLVNSINYKLTFVDKLAQERMSKSHEHKS